MLTWKYDANENKIEKVKPNQELLDWFENNNKPNSPVYPSMNNPHKRFYPPYNAEEVFINNPQQKLWGYKNIDADVKVQYDVKCSLRRGRGKPELYEAKDNENMSWTRYLQCNHCKDFYFWRFYVNVDKLKDDKNFYNLKSVMKHPKCYDYSKLLNMFKEYKHPELKYPEDFPYKRMYYYLMNKKGPKTRVSKIAPPTSEDLKQVQQKIEVEKKEMEEEKKELEKQKKRIEEDKKKQIAQTQERKNIEKNKNKLIATYNSFTNNVIGK